MRHLEHRDEARDPPLENEQSSVHADVSQAGCDRWHLPLRQHLHVCTSTRSNARTRQMTREHHLQRVRVLANAGEAGPQVSVFVLLYLQSKETEYLDMSTRKKEDRCGAASSRLTRQM
jgi:hypothetical protein